MIGLGAGEQAKAIRQREAIEITFIFFMTDSFHDPSAGKHDPHSDACVSMQALPEVEVCYLRLNLPVRLLARAAFLSDMSSFTVIPDSRWRREYRSRNKANSHICLPVTAQEKEKDVLSSKERSCRGRISINYRRFKSFARVEKYRQVSDLLYR